jgi:hypothetical protein
MHPAGPQPAAAAVLVHIWHTLWHVLFVLVVLGAHPASGVCNMQQWCPSATTFQGTATCALIPVQGCHHLQEDTGLVPILLAALSILLRYCLF